MYYAFRKKVKNFFHLFEKKPLLADFSPEFPIRRISYQTGYSVKFYLDEILLKIPADLVISVSSILEHKMFEEFCFDLKMELTPYDVLSIYLLVLSKISKNNPYVNSLQKSFDCPITWSLEELRVNRKCLNKNLN